MSARVRAAALHLAASILIVGGGALIIATMWFPAEHQRLLGGYSLLILILSIDVVAGPLLTLVVFDKNKPRLAFDLAIIALAQLAFLSVGAYTAAIARPVYLVATSEKLYLVTANKLTDQALRAADGTGYEHLSWTGPRLVGARRPPEEAGGRAEHLEPRYFVPYERVAPTMVANAVRTPEDFIRVLPPHSAQALQAALEGYASESIALIWLIAPNGAGIAVADRSTGKLLRILDVGLQ